MSHSVISVQHLARIPPPNPPERVARRERRGEGLVFLSLPQCHKSRLTLQIWASPLDNAKLAKFIIITCIATTPPSSTKGRRSKAQPIMMRQNSHHPLHYHCQYCPTAPGVLVVDLVEFGVVVNVDAFEAVEVGHILGCVCVCERECV